jgi:hypothetical protein
MRWRLIIAGVAVVAVLAWLIVSLTRGVEKPSRRHVATQPAEPTPPITAPPKPSAKRASVSQASHVTAAASSEDPPASLVADLPGQVDLDWLRARLPGNRYWSLGVPTDDIGVASERAEYARLKNELYGKILSGTGTDDDIERYFDERKSLLADYAEVARVALEEGGDQLSERDRNLFQLALKMDQDRFDALPRERDDAIARKQLQDKRRAEWNASNH